MKNIFVMIIILSAMVLITSCGKSKQQIKEEKDNQLNIKNEKAISDIARKYNSISEVDSLNVFTYVLQEMFIDKHKSISLEGELKDIIKSDSVYILEVYHRNKWGSINDKGELEINYIAQISILPEKFIKLKKQLNSKNHSHEGCFIFKVSKIIPIKSEIKSNMESDDKDSYSYLFYNFDKTLLIFKGDLIDFYLDETIEKENE